MKAALFALFLAPLAAAAQAPETLFNLVSLQAQAEREVPNDLLNAVLAAEAEGTEPTKLSAEVNRAMQAALAIAKGYAAVRARSGNYQTFPVYDKERIVRWRARQELRLESQDFAAAAELSGKLQASLVVAGMSLAVSPEARRKAENALIAEALAAFDERAEIVRSARKEKGFRVRSLQISGNPLYPVAYSTVARPAPLSASAPAPAIAAGTSRVLITVSGTVQLQ